MQNEVSPFSDSSRLRARYDSTNVIIHPIKLESIMFRIEMTQLSLKQEVQKTSNERVEILSSDKLAFNTDSI